MKGFYVVVTLLGLTACAQLPVVTPPAQSDYELTLNHAHQYVQAGNYWAAERLFNEFLRTHEGTREAREISFWKAAYMVDPANDRGSLNAGIAALDQYLATDSVGYYINEARLLRRTAAAARSSVSHAATGIPASTTGTKDTVVVVSRSREDEIASLKDQLARSREELAKVSAELERIKKRLANPSN